MEPTAEEIQTMRLAIEKNLVSAIETRGGECVAYDEKSGEEYGQRQEKKIGFDHLFVHQQEVDSTLLHHMELAHPSATIQLIKHNTHAYDPRYGNSSSSYKDHFREKAKKAALLHRAAKWKPDPNGNSTDFLPGQMMAQGCGFGCTYCYTERHFVNNYPKMYGDVYKVVDMIKDVMDNEADWRFKMKESTRKDFEKHRDPKHGNFITFDLGCDSDCTLDNQLTQHSNFPGHIVDIMNQVSEIPNAMTSFATKSAAFDSFLEHTKRPQHHRIRLSLMPEHHRKTLEINTAPIQDRLSAINRLVDKGFEVHINLSPIVVTESHEKEYRDLLSEINDTLSKEAKAQMAYEAIYLTHTEKQFPMVSSYAPKAHKMMVEGPCQLVPKPNKPQVLSYTSAEKRRLKSLFREIVNEITPYSRVRYCY